MGDRKHSITSLPDVSQIDRPMVALWGDSYVEALQVADQQKPAQQVTRIWNSQNDMPLVCVGIGSAGRSVADYWWLMPRYEELIVLRAHYILVLGGGEGGRGAWNLGLVGGLLGRRRCIVSCPCGWHRDLPKNGFWGLLLAFDACRRPALWHFFPRLWCHIALFLA